MSDIGYEALVLEKSPAEFIEFVAGGIDVNAPDTFGDLLLLVACEQLRPDIVRCLIQAGANVNCHGMDGDTPLLSAIDGAHLNPEAAIQIAKMLLSAGAGIELRGYMDKTPFLKACSRGCLEMLMLLVANGCDVQALCTDPGGNLGGRDLAEIFNVSSEFKKYLHGLYESA